MTHSASFIPPNVPPPDPPEAKVLAVFFSIFMSVIFILVIGLVCFDFFAEMAGVPLFSVTQPSPQNIFPSVGEETVEKIEEPFELITPKHQTQMIGPDIVVIYTRRLSGGLTMPPELLLNDSLQPWNEQFGNNTWFARLQLQAGQYHIQVEESEAEFFVETLGSPSQSPQRWVWNRPHPDTGNTDQCFDCHEQGDHPTNPLTTDYRPSIGYWKGVASCFACHDEEEHQSLHAIFLPVTKQCLRCHTIH